MLNPLNPFLVAVGVATGPAGPQAVYADLSNGVDGGHPGAVNLTVGPGWSISLVPRQHLLPVPPFLCGSAVPHVSAAVFGPGAVLALLLPEALGFQSAGAGQVTAYL